MLHGRANECPALVAAKPRSACSPLRDNVSSASVATKLNQGFLNHLVAKTIRNPCNACLTQTGKQILPRHGNGSRALSPVAHRCRATALLAASALPRWHCGTATLQQSGNHGDTDWPHMQTINVVDKVTVVILTTMDEDKDELQPIYSCIS